MPMMMMTNNAKITYKQNKFNNTITYKDRILSFSNNKRGKRTTQQ